MVGINESLKSFTSSSLSAIKPMLKQADLVNDKQIDNPDSLLKNFKHLEKENKKRDPSQKPTLEQLLLLKEKLINHLPKFLKTTHPYALYTPDVIFENNYDEPGKTTIGIFAYMVELIKIRFKINIKFSNAVIEILKITHDERDGTVKIRWRLRGYRGFKSMFVLPWKINPFDVGKSIKDEREWHDGFSIMYVNGLGHVYKHTLQRVMTNEDESGYVKDKKKTLNLNVL